jgi:hypothetical protein
MRATDEMLRAALDAYDKYSPTSTHVKQMRAAIEAALALPQPAVADEERAREIIVASEWADTPESRATVVLYHQRIARALAAVRAECAHHVEMLLPLAKGYVAAHPGIASTQEIVAAAEAAIRQVRS